MKIQKYKFFDQQFELRSDDTDTLTLIDVMFRRFAVTDNENNSDIYQVLTNLGGQAEAGIITKNYCYKIEQPKLLPSLAHGIILRNTLEQIRSHLLFHAATLSRRGKGIILAADSGCGKTTLTLALVRQGFKFLSDEVAALSLKDGKLTPYPRCLLLRMGTLQIFQQLGWKLPPHHIAHQSDNRIAIHFSPALLGDTCQPHNLIIIERPDKADDRICKLTLDSLPDRLLADLQTIVAHKNANIDIQPIENKQCLIKDYQYFPVLKAKEAHINKIHQTCEQHGVLVLDVEEAAVAQIYYDKAPQLQEISKLTAVLSLLKSFLGGYRSALIQENYQGSVAGLVEPLVKILEPVKCYKLTPGKLDDTVEIISAIC